MIFTAFCRKLRKRKYFVCLVKSFAHTRYIPEEGRKPLFKTKEKRMSAKEILQQRDLLDQMLAARVPVSEHKETMKLMDDIYFNEKLPKNVIRFPLERIKRINVYTPAKQPGKNNKKLP